ncbi:MAG: SMC-Scp complex subunit ScpB [Elusimicrobiota bacterium]
MNKKNDIKNIVECLLFVSSKPVSSDKLAEVIQDTTKQEVEDSVNKISKEYKELDKPVFIQKVAGGWRMATKEKYAPWIKKLFSDQTTYNLSRAALETLAIVAYRQPITTQEVDTIRGVSSGGVLRGLLEKKLIKIAGRKETLGRPIIYRTSDKFLEYFGLESLSDIPPLEELGIEEDVEEILNERNKEKD